MREVTKFAKLCDHFHPRLHLTVLELILISFAAFFGGILNAIAGGGTFVTFPALVAVGIPAVPANATATLAALPGYISSSWGFREELARHPRASLKFMVVIAGLGGVVGAGLLLLTSEALFQQLVPWLLLFATLVFAFGERITAALKRETTDHPAPHRAGLITTAIYGGYFNGGLGIILLALFAASGYRDIHQMNGLKTLLSAVLALTSVTTFIFAGLIAWPQAVVMMLASIVGGYAGVVWAKRLPPRWVKWLVVGIASMMTLIFFANT